MSELKYFAMKNFKLNTEILIICCALIASGISTPRKHIGEDGREYLIECEYKINWFQAWHACARQNRQLLTIDSPEKHNVVKELIKKETFDYLWLGANDEFNPSGNADRSFFWSATGKEFRYVNWKKNFPEKIDDNRHCIQFGSDAKWFNWKCDDKVGFICEEKELLTASNTNPNNITDVVQKFINDFDLKFQSLLKDNMAQLNGKLENIKQVGEDTNNEVENLTNITQTAVQKILNKQEISTKGLNHEITKQGNGLSDQLKRSVDELNVKFTENQNLTYPPKNIVLIKNTG